MSGSAGFGDFVVAGVFNVSPPAPANGQKVPFQMDSAGNLLVNVAVGGGGGSSSINSWGGQAVSAAENTASSAGTEFGPVTRPIQRRFSQILTTTPLGSNGVFTSAWFDSNADGTTFISVTAFADQNAATDGILIQETEDTTDAHFTRTLNPTTGTAGLNAGNLGFATGVARSRYWRVKYTNGATAQGTFKLAVTAADVQAVLAQTIGTANFTGSFPATTKVALDGTTVLLSGNMGAVDGAATRNLPDANGNNSNVLGALQFALSSGSNVNAAVGLRTPQVFKTVQATASGNTALWTPTSGKKFRLMRYRVQVTGNAATSGGAVVTISFQDSATGLPFAHDLFLPSTGGTTMQGYDSGWIDLGNGYLSTTANNVLNVNLSAALSAGNVRVQVCGTEE